MIIYKSSLGSHGVTQKIWARSVQPFWHLLDTNKQTNRHPDKPNLYIDYAVRGASRLYSILIVNMIFLFKKRFADFINNNKNSFEILIIHKPFLGSHEVIQNLGPIGSAVLTFIGYKQTDRQIRKVFIKIKSLLENIIAKR